MDDYHLRWATNEDAPVIRAIVRQARINPTQLDWRRFVVAATVDNEVIGCGQVKPHRDGSLELASLAVVLDWQGRGVGRAITEYLLDGQGGTIYLMCRSSLGNFYQKMGFKPVKLEDMPRFFSRVTRLARGFDWLRKEGETLLVMRWDNNFRE
jgi:N-acetylglutamate synthase-like GNAT family acetyltransferase